MAELYKCRRVGPGGFDKFVAIKRVLPQLADEPELINMFLDEARLAANLTHPHIVQIFEIDEEQGAPYIVMEYVQGPTLRSLSRAAIKQTRTSFGHPAKIISDICEGLHYAHQATAPNGTPLHLVHRDVSPQNIMVTPEGSAKLLDFGVAKAVGRLAATDTGTIKGKIRYMAPEQLRGEEVDGRADVFSLGVCLYEATTGALPFAAPNPSDAAQLQAIVRGVSRKPSELVPGYPAELERAVLWAIEPDLRVRCPNARALHEALERFIALPEQASSTIRVAAWVRQLFPAAELQPATAAAPPPLRTTDDLPEHHTQGFGSDSLKRELESAPVPAPHVEPLSDPKGHTRRSRASGLSLPPVGLPFGEEHFPEEGWEMPDGAALELDGRISDSNPSASGPAPAPSAFIAPAPQPPPPLELARQVRQIPNPEAPVVPYEEPSYVPTAPGRQKAKASRPWALIIISGMLGVLILLAALCLAVLQGLAPALARFVPPAVAHPAQRIVEMVKRSTASKVPTRRTEADGPPTLVVDSDPSGAEVKIEGQRMGVTPLALENLYSSERVGVEITRRGYRPWIGTFAGGGAVVIHPRLQRR